jgi:uncharacterized protein YecE (DUF72 family)
MIWVGTSGWQYASWRGRFYATDVPQRAWLEHYATRFPVVEVNNSFYMLPKETTFDRWREIAPRGFVFVVKASRYITHIRRLRGAKDSVDLFWSRATRLGNKLGPVLFQLPPTLRADPLLLEEFLAILPKAMRPAFEFRNDSWRDDRVFDLLDRAGAAWVLADRPGWRVPLVVTGGWSYLRFHQGRPTHPAYSRRKLRTWAERIAELPANDTYAFFNNDERAAAPGDALTLMGRLQETGEAVAQPATK